MKDTAHLLLVSIEEVDHVLYLLLTFEERPKILSEKAIAFGAHLAHIILIVLPVYRNVGFFLGCVVVLSVVRGISRCLLGSSRGRFTFYRRFIFRGLLEQGDHIGWALSDE